MGGPQFQGPFEEYCRARGIKHETSSPYNPRSNGHAEAAVKAANHLILKTASPTEFEEALAAWRNTAREKKPSPSEMLLGRKIRDNKPMALLHIKKNDATYTPHQQIPGHTDRQEDAFHHNYPSAPPPPARR